MPRKKQIAITQPMTSNELLALVLGEKVDANKQPRKPKKYTMDSLLEENQELMADNDLLRSENEHLTTIIERLQRRIESLELKLSDD